MKEYEIINRFGCYHKEMVTVRLKNGVHVMPIDEWRKLYGRLHPERWYIKSSKKKLRKRQNWKSRKRKEKIAC